MKYLFILLFLSSFTIYAQNETSIKTYEDRLESIKIRVKESIDASAFDEDSKKRRYKVKFEGNKMRLLIMKADGSKPINKGLLYDFSRVFSFDDISFRRKDVAYLNIRTYFLDKENYPKRKKWVKIKLIMKVFGHKNAETIYQALKEYNSVLLEKKEQKN